MAAGHHVGKPHEAWISADLLRAGFSVLIPGPQGLERSVFFTLDEALR